MKRSKMIFGWNKKKIYFWCFLYSIKSDFILFLVNIYLHSRLGNICIFPKSVILFLAKTMRIFFNNGKKRNVFFSFSQTDSLISVLFPNNHRRFASAPIWIYFFSIFSKQHVYCFRKSIHLVYRDKNCQKRRIIKIHIFQCQKYDHFWQYFNLISPNYVYWSGVEVGVGAGVIVGHSPVC